MPKYAQSTQVHRCISLSDLGTDRVQVRGTGTGDRRRMLVHQLSCVRHYLHYNSARTSSPLQARLYSGAIRWNGATVADPASFLVPPRAAYTPQVPVFFSETLRGNLLLGLPEDASDLSGAIHAAVLEKDIATLDGGLATRLGPRGVRLSGGQLQRAAAAQTALVDTPRLLSLVERQQRRAYSQKPLRQEGLGPELRRRLTTKPVM